jgi:hypothetical protein
MNANILEATIANQTNDIQLLFLHLSISLAPNRPVHGLFPFEYMQFMFRLVSVFLYRCIYEQRKNTNESNI